ncbi:hypothetical protein [Sanguibacter sp. 25GB23B1]|uniref:hypothetical protein n=1 Tax=unclassified Sanguibacter TaxID=2645534 RepID=UPI0032AF486E
MQSTEPTGEPQEREVIAVEPVPRPRVQRWRALHIVWKWMIVVATAPSAVWAVVVVVGSFAYGPEALLQGIDSLMFFVVMIAVPGALLGLVIGLVDLRLGRYVERRPGSVASIAAAAAGMFLLLTAAARGLFAFTSTSGVGVLAMTLTCMAWALVPALITLRRYRRISLGTRSARV